MSYEHVHVDLTSEAMDAVAAHLRYGIQGNLGTQKWSTSARQEVQNFLNELEARLQHVLAGLPDMSIDAARDNEDLL